jgi:tRNA 2-thiouridine synthesizing protein A
VKNQLHDGDIPPTLVAVGSPSALTCAVNSEVDARQLACPLPLLKAKQGLRNLSEGELLRVLATDAGSLKDFVSFAHLTGQVIERFYAQDACYCFVIRKQ